MSIVFIVIAVSRCANCGLIIFVIIRTGMCRAGTVLTFERLLHLGLRTFRGMLRLTDVVTWLVAFDGHLAQLKCYVTMYALMRILLAYLLYMRMCMQFQLIAYLW